MAEHELCELVLIGEERRNLEYKGLMRWDNPLTKEKITKCMLAMSNIRDGGYIIIGLDEQPNGTFNRVGLTQEDANTFTHDDISPHVAEYADPYLDFNVHQISCEGKIYVVIRVKEFEEIPVICKREGTDVHRGKIYTRTRRMHENSEVLTQSEMREIIDLAVEKNMRRFFERLQRLGIPFPAPPTTVTSDELFEKQLEGLR